MTRVLTSPSARLGGDLELPEAIANRDTETADRISDTWHSQLVDLFEADSKPKP